MTTEIDVDAVIEELVRRLVERFAPLQVVLFGSQARGEAGTESDVDLLLVVPEAKRSAAESEAGTAVRGAGLPAFLSVEVITRTPEQVWRESRVPGSLVRNALREGRVVYEHDERPSGARELLRLAREDLDFALLGSRGGGVRRTICFLAQQAAEKALKAALAYAGVDYPRTHELDVLRDLLPDDWPLKAEYPELRWLSNRAVTGRYGVEASAEESEAALTTALGILESVVRDLRAHGLEVGEDPR